MAYPQQTLVQQAGDDDCLLQIDTRLDEQSEQTEIPFVGGWLVFLSYEYASLVEPGVAFFGRQSELPPQS